MVQKIHPWGVIWVSSIQPRVGRLSEKNDDLAVQYQDVHNRVKFYLKLHLIILGVIFQNFSFRYLPN